MTARRRNLTHDFVSREKMGASYHSCPQSGAIPELADGGSNDHEPALDHGLERFCRCTDEYLLPRGEFGIHGVVGHEGGPRPENAIYFFEVPANRRLVHTFILIQHRMADMVHGTGEDRNHPP